MYLLAEDSSFIISAVLSLDINNCKLYFYILLFSIYIILSKIINKVSTI